MLTAAEKASVVVGYLAQLSRVKNLAGFRARESWVPRGLPGRGGPHGDGSRPGVRAA